MRCVIQMFPRLPVLSHKTWRTTRDVLFKRPGTPSHTSSFLSRFQAQHRQDSPLRPNCIFQTLTPSKFPSSSLSRLARSVGTFFRPFSPLNPSSSFLSRLARSAWTCSRPFSPLNPSSFPFPDWGDLPRYFEDSLEPRLDAAVGLSCCHRSPVSPGTRQPPKLRLRQVASTLSPDSVSNARSNLVYKKCLHSGRWITFSWTVYW
jgi:hypothetical protein